jgi:ABC-2 type transport system ATP-binding protein
MTAVVRTDQLTKDFLVGFWRRSPRRALDALTLEIARGEVFGLLGPNGAGKTTTLKLLVQLVRPTSGRIEVLGRPAGDRATRGRLGFLPEQPNFYEHLTATELLHYFAGLCGLRGEARRARVTSVLDLVDLGSDRSRPLRQFSKGMLQRVGLAQALVNDPELVVLDEPMSGLDPVGRRDVRAIILRLRDEGRTVLFSSHILSDAEAVCSRVAILARGQLVASGTPAALTSAGHRGWEVVVTGLTEAVADQVRPAVVRIRETAPGQCTLELSSDRRPEPIIAELAAAGASLVSVTPLRRTLEDIFIEHVGASSPGAAGLMSGRS